MTTRKPPPPQLAPAAAVRRAISRRIDPLRMDELREYLRRALGNAKVVAWKIAHLSQN